MINLKIFEVLVEIGIKYTCRAGFIFEIYSAVGLNRDIIEPKWRVIGSTVFPVIILVLRNKYLKKVLVLSIAIFFIHTKICACMNRL